MSVNITPKKEGKNLFILSILSVYLILFFNSLVCVAIKKEEWLEIALRSLSESDDWSEKRLFEIRSFSLSPHSLSL